MGLHIIIEEINREDSHQSTFLLRFNISLLFCRVTFTFELNKLRHVRGYKRNIMKIWFYEFQKKKQLTNIAFDCWLALFKSKTKNYEHTSNNTRLRWLKVKGEEIVIFKPHIFLPNIGLYNLYSLFRIHKICPFLIKSFRFWIKIELYANKRELTLMQQICIDSSQTF